MSSEDEKTRPRSGSEEESKSFRSQHSSGDESDTKSEVIPTSAGVKRMEAVARAGQRRPVLLWVIRICLLVCTCGYILQGSTTYNYEPLATSSFERHSSGLASLGIATSIISSVCRIFIAKISDIAGRPQTLAMVVVVYAMGFIITAASSTLSAYVVGAVFVNIGSTGLDLLVTIILADIVSLEWRGFAQALFTSPYIVTVWIAGPIVASLQSSGDADFWRWGYGMFAIIVPVLILPAIAVLIYLEHKAMKAPETVEDAENKTKTHELNVAADAGAIAIPTKDIKHDWDAPLVTRLKNGFYEIDAIGLIILGFGWSLLLLPFSLEPYSSNGYANRSLIAMFVVGGLCLIAYAIYEPKWAPFPSAPKRVLVNSTFIHVVLINFLYLLVDGMVSLYLSSYVLIVTDWSYQNWTYYNNTVTVSVCFFALISGALQRYFHSYKWILLFGLAVKVIAYGLLVDRNGVHDTARLVMYQVLLGLGGACATIATQVASQASVPHQDVALIISLLLLWSSVGGAIGNAIAVSVWGQFMPGNLRKYLPASVTDEEVAGFYNDITSIKAYDYNSDIRQGAIRAYEKTVWHLWLPALIVSFVPFFTALFIKNIYLGKQQNAYDNTALDGTKLPESECYKRDENIRWYQFWRR